MRWRLLIIAILALTCITMPKAKAEPLVTISYDRPEGFSIQYGVPFPESLKASKEKQSEPAPSLKGPTKDGILGTPTFVIDSNREKMTVTWAELRKEAVARKQAKEHKPFPPPIPQFHFAPIIRTKSHLINFMQLPRTRRGNRNAGRSQAHHAGEATTARQR